MAELRKELADAIKSRIPNDRRARFVSSEKAAGRFDRALVRVSQLGFSRATAAPMEILAVRFNLRVTSSKPDLDEAESQLNDLVPDVCFALEQIPNLLWTDASKVLDADHDERLAYDIPVTVYSRKEP